jgi:hypothetical protein
VPRISPVIFLRRTWGGGVKLHYRERKGRFNGSVRARGENRKRCQITWHKTCCHLTPLNALTKYPTITKESLLFVTLVPFVRAHVPYDSRLCFQALAPEDFIP